MKKEHIFTRRTSVLALDSMIGNNVDFCQNVMSQGAFFSAQRHAVINMGRHKMHHSKQWYPYKFLTRLQLEVNNVQATLIYIQDFPRVDNLDDINPAKMPSVESGYLYEQFGKIRLVTDDLYHQTVSVCHSWEDYKIKSYESKNVFFKFEEYMSKVSGKFGEYAAYLPLYEIISFYRSIQEAEQEFADLEDERWGLF